MNATVVLDRKVKISIQKDYLNFMKKVVPDGSEADDLVGSFARSNAKIS